MYPLCKDEKITRKMQCKVFQKCKTTLSFFIRVRKLIVKCKVFWFWNLVYFISLTQVLTPCCSRVAKGEHTWSCLPKTCTKQSPRSELAIYFQQLLRMDDSSPWRRTHTKLKFTIFNMVARNYGSPKILKRNIFETYLKIVVCSPRTYSQAESASWFEYVR